MLGREASARRVNFAINDKSKHLSVSTPRTICDDTEMIAWIGRSIRLSKEIDCQASAALSFGPMIQIGTLKRFSGPQICVALLTLKRNISHLML